MRKFVFTTAIDKVDEYCKKLSELWGEKVSSVQTLSVGSFILPNSNVELLVKESGFAGFVNGVLRDKNLPSTNLHDHNRRCLGLIDNSWPLPLSITQSFSAIKVTSESIFLANDVVGFYPIYYSLTPNELIVSSHFIPFAALKKVEIDKTGVLQRRVGPCFVNHGRRTLIKNTNRLLPGELLKFSIDPLKIAESKFDNSIYQNMGSSNLKDMGSVAQELWDVIREEHKVVLSPWSNITVSLSGGLDSRLTLGAIPAGKEISCFTYGNESFYESKLARKLSKAVNAHHQCILDYSLFFPPKETMLKYSAATEAVGAAPWFGVMEVIDAVSRPPLLFGDMYEAIPGRNIRMLTSRDSRIKGFFSNDVMLKDYTFTKATEENFSAWKNKFRNDYVESIRNLPNSNVDSKILEEINGDLDIIFERISQHNVPFLELYDELFAWIVNSRLCYSKQMLFSHEKFSPINIMMSANVLIASSNVHPNLRLGYRLMDKMIRDLDGLSRFRHIPSAQTPYIPQSSPRVLKLLVWGVRSKIDQWLIKRMVNAKNPNLRYRVVEFLNWPVVYQNENGHERISDWFTPDYTSDKNRALEIFDSRMSMNSWPLENFDILSWGALNTELQLIEKLR